MNHELVINWADLEPGDVVIEHTAGRLVFMLVKKTEPGDDGPRKDSGFYWSVFIIVPAWTGTDKAWPLNWGLGGEGAAGLQDRWIWAATWNPAITRIPADHSVLRGGRFIRDAQRSHY